MSDTSDTQVLIAGGGPIGLTAAIELARRGIACRIVDPVVEPLQYAKAVGVQPRTLEVFEGMYVVRPDGYLGLAAAGVDPAQLVAHLGATFAQPEGVVAG